MSDKSDAIAALETAYQELLQAVDGIPEDKMATVWFGEFYTGHLSKENYFLLGFDAAF